MSLRPCLGVPAFPSLGLETRRCGVPSPTARCGPCQRVTDRARDRLRGSRRERGYDADHDRIAKQVLAEEDTCGRCGLSGTDTDPLTAGHIDPDGPNVRANYRAEHRSCNSRAARRGARR